MTTFFLVNKKLRGFAGREEISAQPSLIDTRRLVLLTHGDSSWRLCGCMLRLSKGNIRNENRGQESSPESPGNPANYASNSATPFDIRQITAPKISRHHVHSLQYRSC